MTIANVANSATWQLWATATNQMVTIINEMVAGTLQIQTINVAGNVSITNNVVANFIELQENDVGQELTNIWIEANGNLLLVNVMGSLANTGGIIANGAYTTSNGFYTTVNAAFGEANTLYGVSNAAFNTANNSSYNNVFANANSAYNMGSMENRFLNGRFEIDQQMEGGAYSMPLALGEMILDGWTNFNGSNDTQWGSTPVVNFQRGGPANTLPGTQNYLSCTMLETIDMSYINNAMAIEQWIEGCDLADLNYGTPNASPLIITFWTGCVITGNLGVTVSTRNTIGAESRTYFTSCNIGPANTWNYNTVVIPGDIFSDMTTFVGLSAMLVKFCWLCTVDYQQSNINNWNSYYGPSPANNYRYAANGIMTMNIAGQSIAFANMRIRKGNFDVPYIPRMFPEELTLCKRRFQKSLNYGLPVLTKNWGGLSIAVPQGIWGSGIGTGFGSGLNAYFYPIPLEVAMPTPPPSVGNPDTYLPYPVLYSPDGGVGGLFAGMSQNGYLSTRDGVATFVMMPTMIENIYNNSTQNVNWIGTDLQFNYGLWYPELTNNPYYPLNTVTIVD